MAKGWNPIEEQAVATQAARERAQQSFLPELRVNAKNPGPYVIRFGEQGQDVNSFPVHEYKEPDGRGGFYSRRFTCLREVGQECPGCQAGMRVKYRGVYNLIQRQRPVFRKDKDGKAIKHNGQYIIDGYADTVVVANVGGPTAEMLRKADATYRGLMSRDFTVSFSGDTFQSWNLAPVIAEDGSSNATPLSEADQLLLTAKHDLDAYMKPPEPQEAAQLVARYGGNSGAQVGPPQAAPQAAPANQFLEGAQLPPGTNAFGNAVGQSPTQTVSAAPGVPHQA